MGLQVLSEQGQSKAVAFDQIDKVTANPFHPSLTPNGLHGLPFSRFPFSTATFEAIEGIKAMSTPRERACARVPTRVGMRERERGGGVGWRGEGGGERERGLGEMEERGARARTPHPTHTHSCTHMCTRDTMNAFGVK
jgi:hypothetical protein